jgi:hypothetical protein
MARVRCRPRGELPNGNDACGYYSQMNRKIILRSIEVTSSRSSLAGGFALTPRRLIFASVRDGLKAENAHNEPIMSAFHPKANDGERKRKLHRPSKVAQLVTIPEVGCPVQSLRWRGRTLSLAGCLRVGKFCRLNAIFETPRLRAQKRSSRLFQMEQGQPAAISPPKYLPQSSADLSPFPSTGVGCGHRSARSDPHWCLHSWQG